MAAGLGKGKFQPVKEFSLLFYLPIAEEQIICWVHFLEWQPLHYEPLQLYSCLYLLNIGQIFYIASNRDYLKRTKPVPRVRWLCLAEVNLV